MCMLCRYTPINTVVIGVYSVYTTHVRINIWIPGPLLERIDEQVFEKRKTRSGFICEIIGSALDVPIDKPPVIKNKKDAIKAVKPKTVLVGFCIHGRPADLCNDSKCRKS